MKFTSTTLATTMAMAAAVFPSSMAASASSMVTVESFLPPTAAEVPQFEMPAGFRQLGSTLVGTPSVRKVELNDNNNGEHLQFGSSVHISDDGSFLAVGAPSTSSSVATGGRITLFERDDSTIVEALEETSWRPVWSLDGGKTPKERLGDDRGVDMSGDGTTLAVRRGDSTVEVYKVDASKSSHQAEMLGTPIDVCVDSSRTNGHAQTVTLGKTANAFGQSNSGDWVAVSCEDHDGFRGMVVVLHFDKATQQWVTKATMKGANNQDRFGWATSMSVYGSDIVTVAVSSPNHDQRRGMVQSFGFGATGVVSQNGQDMLGTSPGDQFGFSLAMNTIGHRFLVVGAPQCDGDLNSGSKFTPVSRGCVSTFGWKYQQGWVLVGGRSVYGEEDGDKLGRSVAISKNGVRIAASSYLRNRQAGVVNLYERDFRIQRIASFEQVEQVTQFGYSVALSETGSVLVAGAPRAKNDNNASVGTVKTYLDGNPFCGIPTIETPTNDLFLARKTCRSNGGDSTIDQEWKCKKAVVHTFQGEIACVWRDDLAAQSPSSAPSSVPSSGPTSLPTSAPSFSPSMAPSTSPTVDPDPWNNDHEDTSVGSYTSGNHVGSNQNGNSDAFPNQKGYRDSTLPPKSDSADGIKGALLLIWNEYKVLITTALVFVILSAVGCGAWLGCKPSSKKQQPVTEDTHNADADIKIEVEMATPEVAVVAVKKAPVVSSSSSISSYSTSSVDEEDMGELYDIELGA